jgi:hypothetical protein
MQKNEVVTPVGIATVISKQAEPNGEVTVTVKTRDGQTKQVLDDEISY